MSDAISVVDLVVVRGKSTVLNSLSCRVPAGRITGLLGPSGVGQDHVDPRGGRGAGGAVGHRHRARPAGRLPRTAGEGRLYVTQAPLGLPGSDGVGERPLLRRDRRASAAAARAAVEQVGLASARIRWSAPCPAVSGHGRRWPARSSVIPRCWCWTSRPSARIRCCARNCGPPSASARRPGRPCWSPRT